MVDQDRAGPGCFAVGLDRITTQQGVDGDGGGCHRSCQRYWTPQTRSLVKLPEVLGIRNMSRARAISDLLVVALCRTSSTSSPAEGTRSTVHNNRGLYSMRYLRPLRLRCCRPSCWTWRGHRGCQRYWIPRTRSLVKLPEVSEIRNMLRARANSDLLVVELCRTSSTSSPAERERSTVHNIGEFTSWDT